jgi:hypothetical protein
MMQDLPWIIGIFIAIGFFAWFEADAFRHPERTNTLSHFIFTIGSKWPLSIWLMGLFAGGLATHFFWHWCPAGSLSTGWLFYPAPLSLLAFH